MSAPRPSSRKRAGTGSSTKSRDRSTTATDYNTPPSTITTMTRHFDPCVATADMFLYGQGNSVVCCHHDTLTIERRFSRHPEEIQLLAVDNVSERGSGRLVVSYDAGQNAIVWDIISGNEVARFASFSNLTAVAWMASGAVAFGNDSGRIIIFEPETSEHVSYRTIDQIAVTSLAPAGDCRTFAIGYQNGSLLICNLEPRFTILHNLTTSRGPSPIVSLSWHASSSRQRSDMLAVQAYDGDLRVWSIAKALHTGDPVKVVRILKRTENYLTGPNWMSWSKNGRIIQFSEGETLSWDVRTKHVTYDSIPTLEHVRGLAVYGPGATLFTLGANNTVQQFDLNAPAVLIANVQHPANLLPPSPPVSVEEHEKVAAAKAAAAAAHAASAAQTSSSELPSDSSAANTSESEISIHLDGGVSESDDDHMSPFARMINAGQTGDSESDIARTDSPANSSLNQISDQSIKSGNSSQTPGIYPKSIQSRGLTEHTYISIGSSIKSSQVPAKPQHHHVGRQSIAYSITTGSTANSSHTGASRPSGLRNEIPRSPDDAKVHDLFKYTRSRLSDIPYRLPPAISHGARLTNDDLRRQMLSTIFGWSGDIEGLVRDEMNRHPTGSPNRILLAKWLGDIDSDIMKASSETMTSSDWMLLALSGIGGQASQHKLGRAYTQRLLESGDLHAAATIMIGMGDQNDAIEVYGSHHKYMEALLVASLFFPSVWERQSHLIKKWGGWAIKNGQRELAIRCAACTGTESTEPWTSPSAAQLNFPSVQSVIPDVLSPPLSPPSVRQFGPQRSIAKTSSLKLITNFSDDKKLRNNFFSDADADGVTPIAGGVTPILDSAISPAVGNNSDLATALLRPSQRSVFNTPNSARAGGSFDRQRLPSIGETPSDANHPRNILKGASDALESRASSEEMVEVPSLAARPGHPSGMDSYSIGMALQRASTSSPLYRRKDMPPPSPSPGTLALLMDGRHSRNGPRNRIPDGIDLQIDPAQQVAIMDFPSELSNASTHRFRWPSRRRGPSSTGSSVTSGSSYAQGSRSTRFRVGYGATSTKTLNDYINSLDAAKSRTDRSSSAERLQKSRESSRNRGPSQNATPTPASTVATSHTRQLSNAEDRSWAPSRGYPASKTGGKRSPRSPVPMSPEDLINLSTPRTFARDERPIDEIPPLTVRKTVTATIQAASLPLQKSRPNSRNSYRDGKSRNASPDRRPPALEVNRGRKNARTPSAIRSPSSPLPFSNDTENHFASEDDIDDYEKARIAQEQFRNRGRSSSYANSDMTSSAQARDRSHSRRRTPVAEDTGAAPAVPAIRKDTALAGPPPAPSAYSFDKASLSWQKAAGEELDQRRTQSAASTKAEARQLTNDERARRKAAAARELEERRKSLVRQQLAPPVMHPHHLSTATKDSFQSSNVEVHGSTTQDKSTPGNSIPPRSHSTEPDGLPNRIVSRPRTRSALVTSATVGLPATPKAMRLVLESGAGGSTPNVPPIPASYMYQRPNSGTNNSSPRNISSPKKEISDAGQEDTLTLLPATVYQPPAPGRAAISRSMSAPPQDTDLPLSSLAEENVSPKRTGRGPRLPAHYDNTLQEDRPSQQSYRRPSIDEFVPPLPLPLPPLLKELAHLARPPPPPPPPLPFGMPSPNPPVVYGGSVSSTIEVVMDDGEVRPVVTVSQPSNVQYASLSPPPLPPTSADGTSQSRNSHQRGRSSTDNTIAGRISRATERMRSASRGRNNASVASRTRSPEVAASPYESIPIPQSKSPEMAFAPYESVPPLIFAPRKSPPQQYQNQMRTGLHESEMI